MPDGRFVSRTISHSEQLASVSLEAAFLFTWCIPHLDVDGRMAGHPQLVKSIACPLRAEIDSGSIPDLLRELSGVGLVHWYEVAGTKILEFSGFRRQQKGLKPEREAKSKFPPHDQGESLTGAITQDEVLTKSGPAPDLLLPIRAKVEVKLSQVQVEDAADATSPAFPPPAREEGSGGDSNEGYRLEMIGLVDSEAKTLDNGLPRKRFIAAASMLVDGSDFTAWQDKNGTQIPWADRPNLLKLAIARRAATGGELRPSLRYVIPQQRDPFPPKMNNGPPPGSPAYEERGNGEPSRRPTKRSSMVPLSGELVRAVALKDWEDANPDRSLELKEKAESQVTSDPKSAERSAKMIEAMSLGVYQTLVFKELNA